MKGEKQNEDGNRERQIESWIQIRKERSNRRLNGKENKTTKIEVYVDRKKDG